MGTLCERCLLSGHNKYTLEARGEIRFIPGYLSNAELFYLTLKSLRYVSEWSIFQLFVDYRVRHTLEFVADYTVDCSVLNSTVIRSLLEDVAMQKYSIIDLLCDSGSSVQ